MHASATESVELAAFRLRDIAVLWVRRFVGGLDADYIEACSTAALNDNMDISRIQAFAQGIEDCRHRQYMSERVEKERQKRARPAGHIVSDAGIAIDTQKIEVIKTWPRPMTPTEWIEACEHRFQELKDRLTPAPVLALPEGSEGYAVYCDASGVGLGCVKKRELLRELHQLASLGVRLLEADDSGVTVQDTAVSSLVVEVKS
ncbi:uncharacterized protein LOC125829029 [Solanum verrucosum]|uniref:uncharacterized protein LOC125829029 n=1 Tax=Solanum verrucosum TaxID=315347 RepID=UPI0020D158B0|nr:uncharacterized protein LOC125829029 [Solanum verrucosum]